MSLYNKLLEIQQSIDHFTKDKKGFQYSYTTGDQVLNHIRPLMNSLGLLLKQEVVEIENTRIDYKAKSGEKSEILTRTKQIFTWIDVETREKDVNSFAANGMNDWDKGLGSALTYAERYFLLKFFHVPTDVDDPDDKDINKKSDYKNKNNDYTNKKTDTKIDENYVITFGKNKGKSIKKIKEEDVTYLKWLVGNKQTDQNIKDFLLSYLSKKKEEIQEEIQEPKKVKITLLEIRGKLNKLADEQQDAILSSYNKFVLQELTDVELFDIAKKMKW